MIWLTFVHYIKYFHGVGIQRMHQLLYFLREYLMMYCQYIQPIHPLQYIHYMRNLRYPLHKYLLMEKVTVHHHFMTRHQKAWRLKVILRHTNTYLIRYWTYRLTQIQIQVHWILIYHFHLTHHTMSIINEYNVQKREKRNSRLKRVSVTQSKVSESYRQATYSRIQIKGH